MQYSLIQHLGSWENTRVAWETTARLRLVFPNATRVLPTYRVFRWGYFTRKRVIYFHEHIICGRRKRSVSARYIFTDVLGSWEDAQWNKTRRNVSVIPECNHIAVRTACVTAGIIPGVINFKFPLQPHQNITPHSMKNLSFHRLLNWKMIILPNSRCLTYAFLSKKLGVCTFWTWEWKGSFRLWRRLSKKRWQELIVRY